MSIYRHTARTMAYVVAENPISRNGKLAIGLTLAAAAGVGIYLYTRKASAGTSFQAGHTYSFTTKGMGGAVADVQQALDFAAAGVFEVTGVKDNGDGSFTITAKCLKNYTATAELGTLVSVQMVS